MFCVEASVGFVKSSYDALIPNAERQSSTSSMLSIEKPDACFDISFCFLRTDCMMQFFSCWNLFREG